MLFDEINKCIIIICSILRGRAPPPRCSPVHSRYAQNKACDWASVCEATRQSSRGLLCIGLPEIRSAACSALRSSGNKQQRYHFFLYAPEQCPDHAYISFHFFFTHAYIHLQRVRACVKRYKERGCLDPAR